MRIPFPFLAVLALAIEALIREGDEARRHQWLAISLGRLALHHGPRARTRMAVGIREVGLRTLEPDAFNAAAHHVMG